MVPNSRSSPQFVWPVLARFPTPIKILLTALLLTLSLGLLGALGQVIVHDIIPTFFAAEDMSHSAEDEAASAPLPAATDQGRGDLFSDNPEVQAQPAPGSLLDNEQFVWTLRWTHIHLFGMSTIFILLGMVTVFLDCDPRLKSWLVALPFVGVVVDIAAMWLKAFVSPVFFWLHIPGGGLFAGIFVVVFCRAMSEMWVHKPARVQKRI